MKLYDSVILKTEELLRAKEAVPLPSVSVIRESAEKVFIFPEDAAVELGAYSCPSAYLTAYTSDETIVPKDEILLIGKDIYRLSGEVPFAHITFVNFDDRDVNSDQECYRILRDIEYKRYKVNPEGYMFRVNTNQIREGGRVTRDAVNRKISFSDIGASFLSAYKQERKVRAVKQVFVTDPDFDYAALAQLAKLNEGITVTLDNVMKNLKNDCSTCNFKNICDEIDGMREIHMRRK